MSRPAVVLADGPLVYLRFGDTSGVTADDTSPAGHDGTYAGTVALGMADLFGDGDPSADLTAGWVSVPFGSWMNVVDLSCEIAVDLTAAGAETEPLAIRDTLSGGTTRPFAWAVDPIGSLSLTLFDFVNGGAVVNSLPTVTNGKSLLGFVYTAATNTVRFFHDGLYVGGGAFGLSELGYPVSLRTSSDPLLISRAASTVGITGLTKDFALFGAALTDSQMAAHFEGWPGAAVAGWSVGSVRIA